MKKRIYLTFVFIVIIFSLTGCRFPSQFINRSEIKKQISENILKKKADSSENESDDEKYIKIIIDAITAKNPDQLYNSLSKELQSKKGIQDELNNFINFTDAKELNIERISSSTSWWQLTDKKDKNGNYYTTVKSNPGYFLKDENNVKYFISIIYYPNYEEHPEKTGINQLELNEEDANGNYVKTLRINVNN